MSSTSHNLGAKAHAGRTALAARFVAEAQPLLEVNDVEGLRHLLTQRYCERDLCGLLTADDADARKVAALALSLVGSHACVDELISHLSDPDPMVAHLAEHAAWSIWCRAGTNEANAHLLRGNECLAGERTEDAIQHFDAAIRLCPLFAEAYNQRGMLHYLAERYEQAMSDCRRCVELMPQHFGAWSGIGHCLAQRGDLADALRAYRRALQINPHLECVGELVRELESAGASVENGSYDSHR